MASKGVTFAAAATKAATKAAAKTTKAAARKLRDRLAQDGHADAVAVADAEGAEGVSDGARFMYEVRRPAVAPL